MKYATCLLILMCVSFPSRLSDEAPDSATLAEAAAEVATTSEQFETETAVYEQVLGDGTTGILEPIIMVGDKGDDQEAPATRILRLRGRGDLHLYDLDPPLWR